MKFRTRCKALRKQYCNRPETRSPLGGTHKSFSANAALPPQTIFPYLPALWLVLTFVFLMIHIVPGDPVEQMLGEGAAPGQLTQLRHALGLDLPLHTQYGRSLWEL